MSVMISSLTVEAHNELGLGEEMSIKNCDIATEVFYSETIFLPIVVMLTNCLHNKAVGGGIIKLNGALRKSSSAPFGVTLEGDIDIASIEQSIGIIKQCIKTTLRIIYPIIKQDLFENLSNHLLSEVLQTVSDGSVISESHYIDSDIVLGVL